MPIAVACLAAWAVNGMDFTPSKDGSEQVWEAEKARRNGSWVEVQHPWASGGAYVESATAQGNLLEYDFELDRPATLRFRPRFWRNSEKRTGFEFPFPAAGAAVPMLFGEDKTLIGYPAGMVPYRKGFYVADLTADKVLFFLKDTRTKTAEINVPAGPAALCLQNTMLYVACWKGQALAIIDIEKNEIVKKLPLDFRPAAVDVQGRRLFLWPALYCLDPETQADLGQYWLDYNFGRDTRLYYGWAWHHSNVSYLKIGGRHKLNKALEYGSSWVDINVKEVTAPEDWAREKAERPPDKDSLGKEADAELAAISAALEAPQKTKLEPKKPGPPFTEGPGPFRMANIGKNRTSLFFFTAPEVGNIGVVDFNTGKVVKKIEVGGYPRDIVGPYLLDSTGDTGPAALTEKIYVTDPLQNRVLILDGKKAELIGQLDVAPMPWEIEVYKQWIYVGCEKKLVVIDSLTDKIVKELPLPARPTRLEVAYGDQADTYGPGYVRGRYPWIKDVIAPRLLIELPAITYDLATLAAVGATNAPRPAQQGPLPGAEQADKLKMQIPLSPYAFAGTISLAMDSDPNRYDWRKNIWSGDGQFLVNDTEEFWRWNALAFPLAAGKHTLKVYANNPYAQLDACVVWQDLRDQVAVRLESAPPENHGVFAWEEPVQFNLEIKNLGGREQALTVKCELKNYLQQAVAQSNYTVTLAPFQTNYQPLVFGDLKDSGRFYLSAQLASADGKMVQNTCFVRCPKDRGAPHIFFRKADLPAIQVRIRQNEQLFKRYGAWLKQQIETNKFLPKSLSIPDSGGDFENEFHAFTGQFAADFLEPREYFRAKVRELLERSSTPDQSAPLETETLKRDEKMDLLIEETFRDKTTAPKLAPGKLRIEQKGDPLVYHLIDTVLPDLMATDEIYRQNIRKMLNDPYYPDSAPLTPQVRAELIGAAGGINNTEKYFGIHAGKRGGTWGYSPWTTCTCPQRLPGGVWEIFKWSRSMGEDAEFTKPVLKGYFTFQRYVPKLYRLFRWEPEYHDHTNPWRREPLRMMFAFASRNPIERYYYGWDDWIRKMNSADLPEKDINQLFQKPFAYFFPLLLACGLYDQAAPAITLDELPASVYFDGEGVVSMRSSWKTNATEVFFASGLSDVSPRYTPNHFMIVKGGEFLASSAANEYDHGDPVRLWANTVVIGDDWRSEWQTASGGERSFELQVYDRYQAPQRSAFHQHIQNPFVREGEVVAYETTPEFDYAAGDATQSWPIKKVKEVYRQLVFIKPDVVVVFDRVKLRAAQQQAWLLSGWPNTLQTNANTFTVAGRAFDLCGRVLLPQKSIMQKFNRDDIWRKSGDVLMIRPAAEALATEYLVVLNVGAKGLTPLDATAIAEEAQVGAQFKYAGKDVRLLFRKDGAVGGQISIAGGPKEIKQKLAEGVKDNFYPLLDK